MYAACFFCRFNWFTVFRHQDIPRFSSRQTKRKRTSHMIRKFIEKWIRNGYDGHTADLVNHVKEPSWQELEVRALRDMPYARHPCIDMNISFQLTCRVPRARSPRLRRHVSIRASGSTAQQSWHEMNFLKLVFRGHTLASMRHIVTLSPVTCRVMPATVDSGNLASKGRSRGAQIGMRKNTVWWVEPPVVGTWAGNKRVDRKWHTLAAKA